MRATSKVKVVSAGVVPATSTRGGLRVKFVFPCARRPRLALLALCLVVLAVCVVLATVYVLSSNPAVAYIISTDQNWADENWEGALASCAAAGFMLASLYSAGDAGLLKAAALSADQNVWIGANDREVEGRWLWADGVSLAARGYGQRANGDYERPPWSAGEPNNAGGEHCARFDLQHSAGALNDFHCDAVGAYACERNRWNPQLLLLLLLLLLPCVCYPVVSFARRCRARKRGVVAPDATPLKLPQQIQLSGTIEFVSAKEGSRHSTVAFLHEAAAIAVCVQAAEAYAAVLDGAKRPWPKLFVEGHTSSEPNGHADSVRVSKARAELCATHIRRRLRELRPGWLAALSLRGLVVSVGYGASRPRVGSVGKNHKENRRVEVHMRMSKDAEAVKKVRLKETAPTEDKYEVED